MKSIAILTSGGDAPGMNAAIRAVTRSALDQGMAVFGVRQGFQGLIEDQIRPLNARDVGGIIHLGGTFLGSARSKEFREESGRSKALRNLSSHGIEGLVVIGGNGSQTGSFMLSKLGFPVVGVASTIDNDLYGTNVTIGSDTAVNVTLEAIDHLRTTGSSHNRAFLVETMGRDCGYLAMMAGLAGGAEVISTPEARGAGERNRRAAARRLRARQDARDRGDRRGRQGQLRAHPRALREGQEHGRLRAARDRARPRGARRAADGLRSLSRHPPRRRRHRVAEPRASSACWSATRTAR